MNSTLLSAALAAVLMLSAGATQAATFSYHGSLQDAGKPAEGSYDLELTLYSAAEGGKAIAGPLTMYRVPVHEGTFSTEVPFPALAPVPQQAWLGVRLRSAGSSEFASLGARAPVGVDALASAVCPGAWTLSGNAGIPSDSYLGTADNVDLHLKANGSDRIVALAAQNSVSLSGGYAVSTSGAYSTAISDSYAALGDHSFAGGYSAGTLHDGSFVWGDHPSTPHKITDSGPNQFVIQAGGGVGINEAPTSGNLSIGLAAGDPSDSVDIRLDGIKSWDLGVGSDGSFFLLNSTDVTFPLQSYVNGGDGIEISNLSVDGAAYKPGGGTWSTSSDRRIKQDIAPIENAVDTLLKLKPVSFRYVPEYRAMERNLADKLYLGFIAQEFAAVFPEAVMSTDKRVPGAPADAVPILALDSNPALITTVAAVQELAVQNADLYRENVELHRENAEVHRQIDALAARLAALEHGRGK